MKQLIEPVLPGKGVIGLCLQYARARYNAPAKYPTATVAWQNTKFRLPSVPTDVKVPLWFSYQKDGHVVISVPGVGLYSSPMVKGENYHLFNSIKSVESYLGAKYLGCSLDIDDVKVAEENDEMNPTAQEVIDAFQKYALKNPKDDAQVQYYMARDFSVLYKDLLDGETIPQAPEVEAAFKKFQPWLPINAPPNTDQTGYYTSKPKWLLYQDLDNGLLSKYNEVPQTPEELKPGIYEVKE